MKNLNRSVLLFLMTVLAVGCSYFAPVYHGPDAMVTIKAANIEKVKAAILTETAKDHFQPMPDQNSQDRVVVGRPLSAAKVFLTTESIRTSKDIEIDGFDLTQVDGGIRITAFRVEQMALPGGKYNEDPLMDQSQHDALQVLLERIKKNVEENMPNQPSEPTPTAGTSAAEQPRVPAAVVAHL